MERNVRLTPLSQKLRKGQTKEEALLWYNFLSKYPLRFRRQYVIGNYIVDFYCHKAKLVVELDGSQHCGPEQLKYDIRRTAFMEAQGYYVLRLSNRDVMRQFSSVCAAIDNAVHNRLQD